MDVLHRIINPTFQHHGDQGNEAKPVRTIPARLRDHGQGILDNVTHTTGCRLGCSTQRGAENKLMRTKR